jgi:hypothetical protein
VLQQKFKSFFPFSALTLTLQQAWTLREGFFAWLKMKETNKKWCKDVELERKWWGYAELNEHEREQLEWELRDFTEIVTTDWGSKRKALRFEKLIDKNRLREICLLPFIAGEEKEGEEAFGFQSLTNCIWSIDSQQYNSWQTFRNALLNSIERLAPKKRNEDEIGMLNGIILLLFRLVGEQPWDVHLAFDLQMILVNIDAFSRSAENRYKPMHFAISKGRPQKYVREFSLLDEKKRQQITGKKYKGDARVREAVEEEQGRRLPARLYNAWVKKNERIARKNKTRK